MKKQNNQDAGEKSRMRCQVCQVCKDEKTNECGQSNRGRSRRKMLRDDVLKWVRAACVAGWWWAITCRGVARSANFLTWSCA